MHLAAQAEDRHPVQPRQGERSRGRWSRSGGLGRPQSFPSAPLRSAADEASWDCRFLGLFVGLCRAAPRSDLHRSARLVLLETLPRVFR